VLDTGSVVEPTVGAIEGSVADAVASAVDVVRDPALPLLDDVLATGRTAAGDASVTAAATGGAAAMPRVHTSATGQPAMSSVVQPSPATHDRLLDPFGTRSDQASGCLAAGIGFAGSGAAGGAASATSPHALLHAALTSAAARLQPGDRLPPAPPASPEVSPD
jgi:hypothetical protein